MVICPLLQDYIHRFWAFSRRAGKSHPDTKLFLEWLRRILFNSHRNMIRDQVKYMNHGNIFGLI